MIVRESPRRGQKHPQQQWPPQSPREAALSSPSGRRKIDALAHQRQRAHERSTSPSPIKPRTSNSLLDNAIAEEDEADEEDEDEDEETLRLKLQRIEAQLKLKKLRKAKENVAPAKSSHLSQTKSQRAQVEVPSSPKKSEPVIPVSPRRVQLGIDKGLRASQVSLKRPQLSDAARVIREEVAKRREPQPAPKTFSERLAEARAQDRRREDRREKFSERKSTGFGLVQTETDNKFGSGNAKSLHSTKSKNNVETSRNEIRHSATAKTDEQDRRSFTTPASGLAEHDPFSGFDLSRRHIEHATLDKVFRNKDLLRLPQILKQVKAPEYEPPDVENDYVIFATVASKSSPRDQAATHKQSSNADEEDPANHRKKFMVLHLTDFKWELDLFLFDAAFDAFWKLTVGSVIAILNPGIMPPKPHMRDSGQFSLKLACSEDALIEIGMSKHLGWCKSVKKDGDRCGQWVDIRKTEFCDFHVNLQIEKTRASRPEVNSMAGLGMFDKRGGGGGAAKTRAPGLFNRANASAKNNISKDKKKNTQVHDWEARHEISYSVPSGARLNTAKLLDAEDYAHGETKRERDIRRAQQRKSERKLLAQLSSQGTGQGGEYARLRSERAETGDADGESREVASSGRSQADLNALGLAGGSATAVKLSPVKGGRYKGLSSSGDQMGWGGAYKRGLLEPTRGLSPTRKALKTATGSGESKLLDSPSKQARFKLPDKKGLRVPGRDSLPKDARVHDNDDDDDLDII